MLRSCLRPDVPSTRSGGDPSGRLVLVPVGQFDLRAVTPLEYAWRIPAEERRALHVATDEQELWALADAWMGSTHSLRLHVVENDTGVASMVGRVVEYELASRFAEVVVLIGRLGIRRRAHRLLHDRSADAIHRVVARIPGVTVAGMTVAMT